MADPAKILVFDSGAGGLTIAREILARHPACELVYVADNKYFPYGVQQEPALIERVTHLMAELIEKYQPEIIVIACNTASTIVLPHLRSRFALPFVGVVPAIKPAAAETSSGVIGILATPATVEREYTDQLVRDFANQHTVYRYGSSALVEMAEMLLNGETLNDADLRSEILKLSKQDPSNKMDTVVLGCTHFPLLRERLKNIEEFSHINWMDCGQAIARRVSHCLAEQDRPKNGAQSALCFVYTCETTTADVMQNYQRYLSGDCNTACSHTIFEHQ